MKNPLYYDLIRRFLRKTGCPVIINTSFNVRGEPLVLSPETHTSVLCARKGLLDAGFFFIDKNEQPVTEKNINWRKELELD